MILGCKSLIVGSFNDVIHPLTLNRSSKFILAVSVSALMVLLSPTSAHADFDDAPSSSSTSVGGESTNPSQSPAVSAPEPAKTHSAPSSGQSNKESNSSPSTSTKSSQNKSSTSKNAPANSSQNNEDGIEHNSSAPVNYSAQTLEGSLTQGRIILKGDVQIEQADAIMKSDFAEIFSSKKNATPQRAVAKGRVSLNKAATATNQELRAVANELEYFMGTRKVILKGKPKIWRGRELLQGEIIEVFLDTNEIKVRGARGVMEPAAGAPGSGGNSPTTGVQNAPAKKSSQTGRR